MNPTARKRRSESTGAAAAEQSEQPNDPLTHKNEVVLVGRVSKPMLKRALPSGDVVGTVRVIVERDARTRYRRSGSVDTIPCVAWNMKAQKTMASWDAGDVIEVSGSLRRRWFRRFDGSSMSDYEVEVSHARRLARAA